jgi:hypothetical protein
MLTAGVDLADRPTGTGLAAGRWQLGRALSERAEGKKHNAALIFLARRKADVLFAMVRDDQPDTPSMPAAN